MFVLTRFRFYTWYSLKEFITSYRIKPTIECLNFLDLAIVFINFSELFLTQII